MSLLQKRLGDFERIAQLAEQYQGLQPMSRGSMGAAPFAGELPQPFQSLATLPTIELSQLLQNVVDSINLGDTDDKGVNRLTVSDSTRAFALIVRMATTAGGEDLADVIEYLDGTSAEDGIIPKLRSLTQRPITDQAKSNQEIFISLLEFWERVKVYLTKMVATVGMPFKNRASASQAYIKTLGFTKLFKGRLPEEFIERQDAQEAVDIRRGAQFPGAAPGAPRRPDDDDEDGGLPPLPPRGRVLRREDTQHGYIGPGSARFDGDDRQRFGYASGEWRTGGRPVGWAGEEVPGYGEAPPAGTEEQQEGKEEFEDEALATVPGNAGPRLRSTMSPQTGEWDIRALPSPFTSPRRRAVADDDDAGLYNPDEAAPAPRAPGAPARAGGLPPFLQSRRDLPDTISGLQQMAARVNAHYKNTLPDGRGAITVNDYSKVRSVKTNFIRRLNIPS